jgi:serine/threonine protein kinase
MNTDLTPVWNVPVVTPEFRGPEVTQSGPNVFYETKPADIYSLGVSLAASISGLFHLFDFKNLIISGKIYRQNAYQKYKISKELTDLMTVMTQTDPSIQQVCDNKWVNP